MHWVQDGFSRYALMDFPCKQIINRMEISGFFVDFAYSKLLNRVFNLFRPSGIESAGPGGPTSMRTCRPLRGIAHL